MCLIPAVRKVTKKPLIAAGGIGSGQAMVAAISLGADAVQVGTRFALTVESSASDEFKKICLNLNEGDTALTLKQLSPTRMVKNELFNRIAEAEARGASVDELREILGKGKAKKGIFEGDTTDGELEIGQVASSVKTLQTAEEAVGQMIDEYLSALSRVVSIVLFK